MRLSEWCLRGVAVFFEYDTPKIVHIKSKRIGIMSRLVQLLIISYVVGFVLVHKKGYQETDAVVSAVTTKMKGNVRTNFSSSELVGVKEEWKPLYSRVWDVADLVVPPVENKAFFITTNLVITPNQTRGECSELADILPCEFDKDCQKIPLSAHPHGVPTGACNDTSKSCIVDAWCPLEEDALPLGPQKAVLDQTDTFTVVIKNMISFPYFGKKRTNILEWQNSSYLSTCRNSENQPFCPVFTLGQIVQATGSNYSEMAVLGGVINIDITWDCNLDFDFLAYCRPVYSFSRLDSPQAKISPGSNFRHADYFNQNRRTLIKAYGLTFIVNVHGSAGKFSFVPTLLNLGAGLALLSVATIICDIIVLYCHSKRVFYKSAKFQLVGLLFSVNLGMSCFPRCMEKMLLGLVQTLAMRSRSRKKNRVAKCANFLVSSRV